MKTLDTKTIIYDSTCPMCTWYTGAFVKTGVLGNNGRRAFKDIDIPTLAKLDPNRSRHEIPLVDTQTGEVVYGLDALTLIVSNMLPLTKPIVTKPWFKGLLKPLYRFISYNRRIITGAGTDICWAPDFSLGWRLALIGLGLTYFTASLMAIAALTGITNPWWLVGVAACWVLPLVGAITHKIPAQQKWDYTGHWAVIGTILGTLWLSAAYINHLLPIPGLLPACLVVFAVSANRLHGKRVNANQFPSSLHFAFAFSTTGITFITIIFKHFNS